MFPVPSRRRSKLLSRQLIFASSSPQLLGGLWDSPIARVGFEASHAFGRFFVPRPRTKSDTIGGLLDCGFPPSLSLRESHTMHFLASSFYPMRSCLFLRFHATSRSHRLHAFYGAVFVWILLISINQALGVTQDSQHEAMFRSKVRPILEAKCFSCHSAETREGNVVFDPYKTSSDASKAPDVWWKALKNIRAGVMPPDGETKLSESEMRLITDWIKFGALGIDPKDLPAGKSPMRRLNRTEYGNTVSDLMGVRFDASILLPPDDSGHGFDNVGDAMTFSPLLLEKYLLAAKMVVEQAVPTTTKILPRVELTGRDFIERAGSSNRNPMLDGKVKQKVGKRLEIPEAGRYAVHVTTKLHGSFDFDPARYVVELQIDQQSRLRSEYGWDENKSIRHRYDLVWEPGMHEITFSITPVETTQKDNLENRPAGDPTNVRFEIASVVIEGPLDTTKRIHPTNYERFFSLDEPPKSEPARREYGAETLRRFAQRAYRGKVEEETIDRLVAIAESYYSDGSTSFEAGIAQAMISVLSSPRFLFRMESRQDRHLAPNQGKPASDWVDEWTLASRLSYLLWSTMPDDELIQLVERGKLREQLMTQVDRMMKDPRHAQFIGNFVGQWLRTRDVTQISVDPIIVLGFQQEYDQLREKFRGRFRRRGAQQKHHRRKKLRSAIGFENCERLPIASTATSSGPCEEKRKCASSTS